MSNLLHHPLLHHNPTHPIPKFSTRFIQSKQFPAVSPSTHLKIGGRIRTFRLRTRFPPVTASAATTAAPVSESGEIVYSEEFKLKRTKTVEGKIYLRMDQGKKEDQWRFIVGCTLPGEWILHWGVHFSGDGGSDWDQPPRAMRPPGSVAIKDYAIETPFKVVGLTEGGESIHEVAIDFNSNSPITAVNFVLRDEETGSWYQHNGRDFKVLLDDYLDDGGGIKKGFSLWTGVVRQLSNILLQPDDIKLKSKASNEQPAESPQLEKPLGGFYEEQHVVKEVSLENSVNVSVRKCGETGKNLVCLETDLPGNVVVHWGVCMDDQKKWEIPDSSYSPHTETFKNKALHTRLQPKEEGNGSRGYFTLEENLTGFLFVLKLNDENWLNYMGSDFFVPLSRPNKVHQTENGKSDDTGVVIPSVQMGEDKGVDQSTLNPISTDMSKPLEEEKKQEGSQTSYTDGIISNIRSLVSDISSKKKWIRKSAINQENLLAEIENLAAEAYSIFRTNLPALEEVVLEPEEEIPELTISSGTGTGYEILCQGFNWESHKSGKWYMELQGKAQELASLGFTVIWLPPPTESVSPEGYMPGDLYNLNSRYGSMDELKSVIKTFHGVGIKVLGDVVLNHRCAQHKNANGIWNIYGGRLNWDDRAVVADDPHFQGRGNKSSGDNFHAAPNIDHSQDFVRKDITEWMRWLKDDIGYDGWRLDFVRGFWGGYVKDYMEATKPYFAVGEFWDSLRYAYGKMEYDQDSHRQRIVDWISAAGGAAGAFDVTTKGILHETLEKCEYWRLKDSKGKPPGVVGWWPSRAVTFIENHDTGSTQGHWRFPGGKEMQGYAYILTHPGSPSVFYDHIFSHYNSEIKSLLSLRTRNKLHCRSKVVIKKAENDVYAAVIDDKVAMKIGPGHYDPPSDRNWSIAVEGNCYKVWELAKR